MHMLFSMNENVQALVSLYLRCCRNWTLGQLVIQPLVFCFLGGERGVGWGLSCREMYNFAVGSGGNNELVPYSA